MAERRMFTQKIIDSDAFLDMPLSTQALYFHLNMRADDDGFVNNPKKIQRMIGASDDDLRVLIAKRFIITFESGIVVIKHWRMHNLLRKDRYNPTQYQEEFEQLEVKENGSYTMSGNQLATSWQPNVNQLATQDSIGKDSIGKDSIVGAKAPKKPTFTKPTLDEIKEYAKERGYNLDAEKFFDYYEMVGWVVGKTRKPMKSWKSAVNTWMRREQEEKQQTFNDGKPHNADGSIDWAELARQGGAVFDND